MSAEDGCHYPHLTAETCPGCAPAPMRALTVQQPWAWAIVHGGKDVENRTQAWSYRGQLAIHAGLRWDKDGVTDEVLQAWGTADDIDDDHHPKVFGAVIGVVDLADVHVSSRSAAAMPCPCCLSPWAQYSDGPTKPVVHLVVENPRPLAEPIPAKGRLGLWTPDAELLDRIREQVPA